MLDWLTLKVDPQELRPESVAALRSRTGRVIRLSPDGQIEWEIVARENIRSDSHQVTVAMGGELCICGSPARVMATDNVFGSGDPVECATAMIDFVQRTCDVDLPEARYWRCTRMDVTLNFDLAALSNVREALMHLRHAEGGRYQLRTAAESVYWSVRSHLRSGKAYAKGPHLDFLRKKGTLDLDDESVELAGRLLRLELSLKSQWWRERSAKAWFEYTAAELEQEHANYFGPLIGEGVEVLDMKDMEQQIVKAALDLGFTEGRGKAAYHYWISIQQLGFETCKDGVGRSSHFRHVKVLKHAGLTFADFQARRVVPLRRRALVIAQPVRSWGELRLSA